MTNPISKAEPPALAGQDATPEQNAAVLEQLAVTFMLPTIMKQNAKFKEMIKEE